MLRSLTVFFCLFGFFGAATARAELHALGMTIEDLDRVAPEHEARSIPVAPGARPCDGVLGVDLTDEMPPVGNQGGQGSCAAWSIAYYHRTQLEYRERGWDLTDPNHQFSPAFTYNQVNGGGDRGSGFNNNMPLICDQGCASMYEFPYNDRDCTTWPSESVYSHAIPFRTKEWMWFHTYDTSGLNRIKQLLVNGSTSCLGINVWGNFDAISQFNNTYCVADKIGSNRGGHAVTIIGYDDTMTTHDGHGAFKLVNSWGPGWGAQGFFWMSYEAVMDHDLSHQAAGFLTDTVGYVPQLLARVRIQHPTRDRVGIQFSVGPRWSALWLKDFRAWRDPAIDWPFPDSKIVFDLTEAAPYITSLQTDSVYFVTWDSRADGQDGSIEHASVQHLDWGTIFASVSTPVQIPDDGSSVTAGMSIRQLDRDVSATCVLAPSGRLEPESSYVPRVEVRNWGTGPATFPVLLTIGAGYADTAQVSGLEPGGAETLAFAPWTVEPRCTVLVRCSTALAADEYTANDTCTALTWARYTDLALEAITVPADTVDSGTMVRPLVRVRNNGTQSELFLVTFKIPDEGYLRSTRTTVSANSDTLVSFAVWLPKNVGSHAMSCTLELAGDMDLSNDTVSGVVVVRAVGIAEAGTRSVQFGLEPPEPSLFRSSVELRFGLPAPAGVSLAIYDATGAVVRRLARGVRAAGVHCLTWDSRDEQGRTVPAGAYFCRLEAGGRRTTAVLLKL